MPSTVSQSAAMLQHLDRDKMAAIPRRHFQTHNLNEKVWIFIPISLQLVPNGLINN